MHMPCRLGLKMWTVSLMSLVVSARFFSFHFFPLHSYCIWKMANCQRFFSPQLKEPEFLASNNAILKKTVSRDGLIKLKVSPIFCTSQLQKIVTLIADFTGRNWDPFWGLSEYAKTFNKLGLCLHLLRHTATRWSSTAWFHKVLWGKCIDWSIIINALPACTWHECMKLQYLEMSWSFTQTIFLKPL